MLIMPYYVKMTFDINKEKNWLEDLDTVNEFLMMKIHPTGPIIFQRGLVGINEYQYFFKWKITTYMNWTYNILEI